MPSVSIPRLEFWPFVPEDARLRLWDIVSFNSPVGILAVCASKSGGGGWGTGKFQFPGWNSGRLCVGQTKSSMMEVRSFNSPVGILAVCAPNP